jgi:ABC-type lipoprotein export system ATPase subunit
VGLRPEPDGMPLLCLESVARSFSRGPQEIAVLKDVGLEVRPGDLVGVYGARSSGKTTLLRIAAGLDHPTTGRVLFQGGDLSSLSRGELARVHREQIGWVDRDGPHVQELPASEYVSMPLYGRVPPAEARRLAVSTLERVGAGDSVSLRWHEISDTVRVLVAIAHALVREPRLLIVDDPTAGLGLIDRERVVSLLRQAANEDGLAVLMAVPDLPAMLHANEIRSLNRGRLVSPVDPSDGDETVVEFPQHRRG